MIPKSDHEEWLAKRLGDHGLHTGLTNVESRRERIRAAIEKVGPSVIAGRHPKTGKSETYAEVWSRLYGIPFESKDAAA